MLKMAGCGVVLDVPLPDDNYDAVDVTGSTLKVRFAHVSDAQIVDEESPARLAWSASLTPSAWRAQEAYSCQLLDGFVRVINRFHECGETIDFTLHTGDSADNAQHNEIQWFIDVMAGERIDPRSGPDDRPLDERPPSRLDPHAPFQAEGLYRQGVHGDRPSIPWYNVVGNHDRFAQGVFPIVSGWAGLRFSPVGLSPGPGIVLPSLLWPEGAFVYGLITPALPGPPVMGLPTLIPANPKRRFFTPREFIEAHLQSDSLPIGHGFDPDHPDRTYYSVEVKPGVRLIALDSTRPFLEQPGNIYSEGSISRSQVTFLKRELAQACERGDIVLVATHHPSGDLRLDYGSAVTPASWIELLNRYDCVALHLCGHGHRHAVFDRGGYLEIETGAMIDAPQQGRVVELWSDGQTLLPRYRLFSHLDRPACEGADVRAESFDDPLHELRREAARKAGVKVEEEN